MFFSCVQIDDTTLTKLLVLGNIVIKYLYACTVHLLNHWNVVSETRKSSLLNVSWYNVSIVPVLDNKVDGDPNELSHKKDTQEQRLKRGGQTVKMSLLALVHTPPHTVCSYPFIYSFTHSLIQRHSILTTTLLNSILFFVHSHKLM